MAPIEPASRDVCRGGPPRGVSDEAGIGMGEVESARSMGKGGGCLTASVRRRITGKRKLVHAGDAGPPEFGGPASKLRRGAGDVHEGPAGAIGGACLGSLDNDEEGPVMHQVRLIDGNAQYSPTWRWRSTDARCGGDIAGAADVPPKFDVAYGEMNTQKFTSFSTAAESTGESSSNRAGGAVAADHPLTGVGRSSARSG